MRLVANENYWDKKRGPRLREVVFRNDLHPVEALERVCTTEGEVDIVTEVAPVDAARVEASEHAKLVATDAVRAIAGVIDRDAEGLPFGDARARRALNLAIDREKLVREAMFGRARPLAGLTPPSAVTLLHRLSPYAHDPEEAARLWHEAGGASGRPVRIFALEGTEQVARYVAEDLRSALGVAVEVTAVAGGDEEREVRRKLAEKDRPRGWDVLILNHGAQSADAPPLELHRAFVGESGEFRAGQVVPPFEELYAGLVGQTAKPMLARASYNIDKFVHEEALALFLCAPQALYAVNRHVDFEPYKTTFELADTSVSEQHWSRR